MRAGDVKVEHPGLSFEKCTAQVWDSIQGLCSYIRGMLSSQAILSGLLPDQTGAAATAGSAFVAFFMRDVSGMLGGVLFAAIQV